MTIENWRLFIQERLRAMDPSISLDEGSPASVQVVEPLVERLSPDPIETNPLLFVLTRLQQEHPALFAEEGGALSDLFAKPMSTLLDPIRRETKAIRIGKSFEDPTLLSSAEADSLMWNFFMNRDSGEYARVKVRLYFQNNTSVNIGSSNVAYTGTGLRFLPSRAQSITSEGMLSNLDSSGLYYFDVSYIAERPGTAYNIGASEIAGVIGVASAIRATNLNKATPGSNEETTPQFIDRGESSMGERSVTTAPGSIAALREEFGTNIKILQIIGFNDSEMHRDVIKGGNLGPPLYYSTDGETSDDGDGDGYTPYFDATSGNFTTNLGPVGTDISGYSLEVWFNDGSGRAPHNFDLKQVEGTTQISISDDYDGETALPDNLSACYWVIRRRASLTLSDIPGGILFPDVVNGTTVTVPDDEVHVGGCTDLYVRGGEIEDKTLALTVVADEDVIARLEDAQTTNGDDEVILNDLTATQWADVVQGRTSLHLETGTDAGAYRIIEKMSGTPYTVRLGQNMTATATDISYSLVDDVDIDLLIPREIRYEGDDLKTVAGLDIVETVGGTPDFVAIGVVDTDYVKILEGDDEGEYSIETGGVSSTQIELTSNMTVSSSPLSYEIYRKQDGIELPLLRVTSVELLDSNLDPTGSYIPYRHPVDARSFSFQNPGRDPKAGTDWTNTINTYLGATSGSDIAVAVNSAGTTDTSFDWYAQGVRPGDILNVNDSDNQGYYTVDEVGGDPGGSLSYDYQLKLTENMRWDATAMEFELGAPSYGSFRLYFLDPVSIETTYADTLFTVPVGSTTLGFKPDPDVWDEFLPTGITIPTANMGDGYGNVSPQTEDGTLIDLHVHGVAVGDRVQITYAPLIGSETFQSSDTVDLDGYTAKFDVGKGTETVTFSGTAITLQTIVDQINAQLSSEVASRYEDPGTPGDYYLRLRADQEITVKDNSSASSDATSTILGTNRALWHDWLSGSFVGQDTANTSPEAGYYLISAMTTTSTLTLTDLEGGSWTSDTDTHVTRGHYMRISRSGRQQISSTEMMSYQDEHGLYYFDVECISEGYGNLWNIDADLQGTVTGYESEGWDITTADSDTSYSMAEEPTLDISPRVLFAGTETDWTEKEELVGRSIQIGYERDPLVEQVHNYMRDQQTRVLCKSPLARSLTPIFVRTSITYRGGSTESTVRALLVDEMESVLPTNELESDELADIIRRTGATKVTHPIELVGIGHQIDRTIVTERSVDAISTGRLSALIPDDDGTTTEGASYIALTRTL